MNKNERPFEDLRIPLENRDAHEKRDDQSGVKPENEKLTREPHLDADTGRPILPSGKDKKAKDDESVSTTFLPGGPVDSLGRTEGPFKPITDLGHDDQFDPKGPKRSHTPKEGGAQFGDQMGSSRSINWEPVQSQGQEKQGDQQFADKFAAGKPIEELSLGEKREVKEVEGAYNSLTSSGKEIKQGGEQFGNKLGEEQQPLAMKDQGSKIQQGASSTPISGEPLMTTEERERALGWSKVTLPWAVKTQQETPSSNEPFMTAEEKERALGWSKVTLPWTVKDQGASSQPITGQEQVKNQEFKDVDLSSGRERRGELTKDDQGVKEGNEHPDKHPEELTKDDQGVKEGNEHPEKQHTGILAGFRHGLEKLFGRSHSSDAEGPKEFTPLDTEYPQEPVAKEQDKDHPGKKTGKEEDLLNKDLPLKKEGDKEQTTLKETEIIIK
jgi:hypothetical protein